MAALILPSRRVVQPQEGFALDGRFDPSFVFVPQATAFDVAGRKAITYRGTVSYFGQENARFVALDAGETIYSATAVSPGPRFLVVIQYRNTASLNDAFLIAAKSIFSDVYGFYISVKGDNSLEFSPGGGSYPTATVTGVGANDGKVKTIVFEWSETEIKTYFKGRLAAVTSIPLPAGAFTTGVALNGYTNTGSTSGSQANSYSLAAILKQGDPASLSLNPWQIFRPIQRRIWVPVAGGGGDVTGSLNATETGSDTFASSGTVLVSGALSATESGSDTFASTGSVVVSGSVAVTESGPDTFAASGLLGTSGSLTVTESGPDTFSATGTTTGGVSGSLDATEAGSDTAAVSGVVVVAGSISVTESGADTFAASGAVVVTGLLNATESGPDTFSALGVTASVNGSLNATEQGSDTAEIRSSEQAGEGRGFVMVDRPSALWWKRKPKALSDEVAEQKVGRVVRVIKEIAGKQQTEQTAKQAQREVAQAIAPMLADMPGFDWTPLYRTIVAEFQRQREDAARIEAVAQIARIRAIEQDDEDILLLMI